MRGRNANVQQLLVTRPYRKLKQQVGAASMACDTLLDDTTGGGQARAEGERVVMVLVVVLMMRMKENSNVLLIQ